MRPGTSGPSGPPVTLRTFFRDSFCHRPEIAAGSKLTRRTYETDINNLQRAYDWQSFRSGMQSHELLVADLSAELVALGMSWQLNRGRTRPTANKLRRHVEAVWNYAAELGLVGPVKRTKRLNEPLAIPECWSIEELGRLFLAADRASGRIGDVAACIWWPALFRVAYNTGARISALMATPTSNLDWERGTLTIDWTDQKDNSTQRFDLHGSTLAALQRLRPDRLARIFDDWPFDRTQDASWPALNRHFRKLLAAAGLRADRKDLWHKLRRTFATHLAAEKGIHAACSWLGHSSVSVTERYLDPRYLGHDRVSEALPFPGQPGGGDEPQLRLFGA